MAYDNLPGTFPERVDGGLDIAPVSNAPRVLVLGTASQGLSEFAYPVLRTQEAAAAFGTDGTLTRGMYEVKKMLAENVILFRIGATACSIEGIGVTGLTGGIKVETLTKDASVSDSYAIYWDDNLHRMIITNTDSDTVVYDRSLWPGFPSIDRGEVIVSGLPSSAGSGNDIGTMAIPMSFTDVGTNATALVVTYVAGTDGTSPSRMKLYEMLDDAYGLLENQQFDIVQPMDVYLDDLNVADMSEGDISQLSYTAGAYPTTNSFHDVLLSFYSEEYQGRKMYWWRKNGPVAAEKFILSFESGYVSQDGDFVVMEDTAGVPWAVAVSRLDHGSDETATTVNLTTTGNWGTVPGTLDLDVDAGVGPHLITLDADCITTDQIVTLINTKIAAFGVPLTGAVTAYRVSNEKIGLRRVLGGAAASLEILAGTACTALGLTVGSYSGDDIDSPAGPIWTAVNAARKDEVTVLITDTAAQVATKVAAGLGALVDIALTFTITDNADGTITVEQVTTGSADDPVSYDITEAGDGTIESGHVIPNIPDVYPTGYQLVSPNGTSLVATDFHEVNFAYQLANFCYVNSSNNVECHGVIGVKPPASASLRDIIAWVGSEPAYTTDSNGDRTITGTGYNGTGLLGNKFMAGAFGFRGNVAGGGFIATDTGFLDGEEQTDRGGKVIDIGAYVSVVGAWLTLYNSFSTSGMGYTATAASTYAGFVATLDPKSAPTNKVLNGVRLPWRVNNTKLDALAGMKYVFAVQKPKGVVVTDAPTAARWESDYQRLTTVRIVKLVVDAVRTAGDPFIGEAGGARDRNALESAVSGAIMRLQKLGYIQRHSLSVSATPAQQVAGQVFVELEMVPAFEVRQITLVIALRPI